MSSLTTLEKRYLEDIFGMAGGYVMDFSNNSFSDFMREAARVEIYDKIYEGHSGSKASRLRVFWEKESDELVGIVISALLDIWQYNNEGSETNPKLRKCQQIASRLIGNAGKSQKSSEDRFLEDEIKLPNIDKIELEQSVLQIIEERLGETQRALKAEAYLSVIFLCGSILEGALLGVAQNMPDKFNKSKCSPKDKNGKVKAFQNWSLAQFIDTACDIGLLKVDVKKFSHSLRDFRNYIHPYEQMVSKFSPDEHTAKLCFHSLKAALACLAGER